MCGENVAVWGGRAMKLSNLSNPFKRPIALTFAALAIAVLLMRGGVAVAAKHASAKHAPAAVAPAGEAEEGDTPTPSKRHGKHPAAPSIPLNQIHVFGDRPAPFALNAHSAFLIDAQSGEVLYAYNEHDKMQPASLAKMMTFYLTLEALKQKRIALDTQIPISEAAWRLSLNDSVSRMFLQVGQRVDVKDLIYGLMVSSGNDAAVALSEYLAGSTDAFADQMNKKAQEIGLADTHFTNPDGLPTDNEYSTAADMVKLGHALVRNYPEALDYTSTKEFTFDKIKQRNFNTLLFYDSRVNGIKTGHVAEAGFHLVASAASGDLKLISAVMGTPSMEKRRVETDKLLDWAFRTYTTVSPDWHKAAPDHLRVYKGSVDQVSIAPAGGTPYFTVGHGDETKMSLAATIPQKWLVAPLPKGTEVGTLSIMIAGKPISSAPLVTQADIKEGGIFHRMMDSLRLKL
jgi:D-alanyl-D-alanine carboxypeptidase (penicillin-binding protein 5/6)